MSFKTDAYIRRAERDDLDTVVAWMEEPDFQHFLYGDPSQSPRQVRERIVLMLGRGVGHTMPGGVYLLIDSPSAGPIGLVSLQNISWRNRSCSIDLYIGMKHLRSRTVTAIAVYRSLEYCFDELNLHRVGAYIYAFNTASWRIFELAGAKRELSLARHVLRDGELHDVYGYGLLREEFDGVRRARPRAAGFSLQEMIKTLAAEAPESGG
jgi:RimJ/RimL family protein N-acetyltransferase